MKVIIAGSRGFTDYKLLAEKMEVHREFITQVVSGGAHGADQLGKDWALEMGINWKTMPAKWNEHGREAGFIRNTEMAEYADGLVAFWDGKSRGTKHMILEARRLGLFVRTVRYT